MAELFFDLYTIMIGVSIARFFAKLITIAILVFAVIGIITTIKWILDKRKPKHKETPHEKWLRTGKMD